MVPFSLNDLGDEMANQTDRDSITLLGFQNKTFRHLVSYNILSGRTESCLSSSLVIH